MTGRRGLSHAGIAVAVTFGAAAVLASACVEAGDTGAAPEAAPASFVAASPPGPARERELAALLKHDCGACHGMRLTGGLGPPLTAAALRDRPADSLVATILSGRPGTPMPPWRPFMSEADAAWLVARLREGSDERPRE